MAGVASHMAIPVGYKINAQAIRLNAYSIAPGQYYMFARSPSLAFPLPLDDSEFVDKYRHLANLVTISQEEYQTVTLTKILTSESLNEPKP